MQEADILSRTVRDLPFASKFCYRQLEIDVQDKHAYVLNISKLAL